MKWLESESVRLLDAGVESVAELVHLRLNSKQEIRLGAHMNQASSQQQAHKAAGTEQHIG